MSIRYSAIVAGIESPFCPSIALAHHFAEQGLHVFIAGRDEDMLEQIASKSNRKHDRVFPEFADLSNEFDIRHLFEVAGYQSTGLRLAVYQINDIPLIQPALQFASAALASMQLYQQGSLFFIRERRHHDYNEENTDFNAFTTSLREQFNADGIQVFNMLIENAQLKTHQQSTQTQPQHFVKTCWQAHHHPSTFLSGDLVI